MGYAYFILGLVIFSAGFFAGRSAVVSRVKAELVKIEADASSEVAVVQTHVRFMVSNIKRALL